MVLPKELTMLEHAPHLHGRVVLWLAHPRRIGTQGTSVNRLGRLHREPLGRTELVILLAKLVEGPLLRSPVGPRRRDRRFLQGAMHALVSSVLLRMSWLDPLRHDAQ